MNKILSFIAQEINGKCSQFSIDLISISDDYTILTNKNFVENQKSVFIISQFAGNQIFLPYAEELYPDLGNIAVHRCIGRSLDLKNKCKGQ
ncbi:hypothetical protein FACS189420_1400 [Bacteroidia bacterium]|nr:hypothetical protein FACS189420_1400 [Bacteroidia bacterium]